MAARKAKDPVAPTIESNDNSPGVRKPHFEMHPVSGLKLDRSRAYLIKGLMPLAELHVLYGPAGSGKSFLALDAALHVAAGRDWAGCKVDRAGSGVVYVASEGARGFRRRVIAAMASRGFPQDIPFALVEEAPDLGSQSDLKRLISDIDKQRSALGGRKPSLIVLDTLARSISHLNESDTQSMNTFIGNAKTLSLHFGALVMPIHHSGKDVERGMRGSSALQGAADAVWCLKHEDGVNRFETEKMKDGPGGRAKAFVLRKHALGLDEDGDEMSTLVVGEIEDADPKPAGAPEPSLRPSEAVERDLPLAVAMLEREGEVGTARAEGLGDDVKAVTYKALHKSFASMLRNDKPDLKPRSEREMATARLGRLVERGALLRFGDWVCAAPGVTATP